jgi:ferredoxin-NADP reductase
VIRGWSSGTKVTDALTDAAPPAPTGAWRRATVRSVSHPSPRAVVLRLAVPDRIDHVPGQHYVIRLTAEDGYVAQRSYSIASPPSDDLLEFYIERLDDGEVSTFLADVVQVGDELDVRGPIGGWFVWDGARPAFGIGGGSGAVPLVAMLRHAMEVGRTDFLRLAVSARTWADLPYGDELVAGGALVALSREDYSGRSAARLRGEELGPLLPAGGTCFICGSAAFAEAASELLMTSGVAAELIRSERFGPTN